MKTSMWMRCSRSHRQNAANQQPKQASDLLGSKLAMPEKMARAPKRSAEPRLGGEAQVSRHPTSTAQQNLWTAMRAAAARDPAQPLRPPRWRGRLPSAATPPAAAPPSGPPARAPALA
ncbi:unnamed protein product [Prorocentrum cordatum]|uniref:Uncharacterized protein n=1 Tax=Prorocentrum cordatum TaxID=2364126 RepID=A0ABN9QDH2_9DINO|nr:unnamed protein product [Polarella glacialis]